MAAVPAARAPPSSAGFSWSRRFPGSTAIHRSIMPITAGRRHRAPPWREIRARRCVAHLHHDGAQIVQCVARMPPRRSSLAELGAEMPSKVRMITREEFSAGFWFSARSSRPPAPPLPAPGPTQCPGPNREAPRPALAPGSMPGVGAIHEILVRAALLMASIMARSRWSAFPG